MGPGAALELAPRGDWAELPCRVGFGDERGGLSMGRWPAPGCDEESIFIAGLLAKAGLGACEG